MNQMPQQRSLHPSFRLHPFVDPPATAGGSDLLNAQSLVFDRLVCGVAFEASAAEAALITRAEFGARLLAQFNLTTPAARERRAADELRAARLAHGRPAQGGRDEDGELS